MNFRKMSHHMGKPTICIGENKGADQLRGNREADHAFVFATRIVQFLFYLNPKFQASSSFLCLYSPVCVGPVRKPHCWFSHEAAQMLSQIRPFYGGGDFYLSIYNSMAQCGQFSKPRGILSMSIKIWKRKQKGMYGKI